MSNKPEQNSLWEHYKQALYDNLRENADDIISIGLIMLAIFIFLALIFSFLSLAV